MKKIVALILSLCLVLAAVPGFATELLSGADTYPLNAMDKTITWYSQDSHNIHSDFADWHDSPFHVNLSTQIGVNIEWVLPTTGADGSVFTNTMMADPSSLPNIMEVYFMNNAQQYLDDEVIWDLTPYIQEYAPAYYAFLQSNPAYDKAMKTDDGRYYAFGFFREDGGWNDSYQGPVVRKDWLEECGLEVPKTISEFENVIRVFNEKYDGAVFSVAFNPRFWQMGMSGAFGAYGNVNSGYMFTVDDGKVSLAQTSEAYRSWLAWFSKLYKEGLIDTDLLTVDDTTVKTKVLTGKSGISLTSMGQMNNWNKEMAANGDGDPWIGIPYPTADDGSLYSIFGGSGIGSITGVITKTADEDTMKLCLQILDYAYTQEGFLYWNYGIEGESWEYDENGVPAWTALVSEDTSTDPMTKYNGSTWSGSCIQATNLLYLKNSQIAIEANDAWFYLGQGRDNADMDEVERITSSHKWPTGVTFTTEEADELDLYTANLATYVTEKCTAFLVGNADVNDDALWNEYISGLETYKLSRVLEIYQNCYDRYLAR